MLGPDASFWFGRMALKRLDNVGIVADGLVGQVA
jgi:hypothetical protein